MVSMEPAHRKDINYFNDDFGEGAAIQGSATKKSPQVQLNFHLTILAVRFLCNFNHFSEQR